ncbi:hypothetical protein NQD34_017460 [Periophthalmus magnuspinnatus]|uniref:Ciliary neurotrophic factor n=1 Tax=Periophthalmus magnuspinnatus TaxID=409849 RepID=A0A3B4B5F7_9GOBI|nr:IL-6 subfamily cytokine M17 [Periophthalmus magnuspinnatus]KAJ0013126.1 hypothetical protein NQD34_017460 [Periophthalmus magnuspinnatus]
MNEHVKSRSLHLCTHTAATLLSLLLVMVFDSTKATVATQQCGSTLLQTLKLARFAQKESVDIIKTYKASQGDMSEIICKVSLSGLPDPNISGLESSEQMSSVHSSLQEFSPHFKRVFDQQTDLQLPDSPLLDQLSVISRRSLYLDSQITVLYQQLFPNSPPLGADGGATSLPPPQNVFQQKVYGCVVLKTYKEFLSNVSKYLRTLKNQMCGINARRINMFF